MRYKKKLKIDLANSQRPKAAADIRANSLAQTSAKAVWGKVVLYLKEKKMISLYVACGDILDVKIEDKFLVISTDQTLLFNLLNERQNIEVINEALKWQNFDGQIKVKKITNDSEKIMQDLKRLESLGIEVSLQ